MREILFRGKNESDEWVYGWLGHPHCHNPDKKRISNIYFTEISNDFKCRLNTIVDYKTVGQFTGLIDKNGKKIFEGDIVRYMNKETMVVVWNNDSASFAIAYSAINFNYLATISSAHIYLEVIGNIHDNPELLEV